MNPYRKVFLGMLVGLAVLSLAGILWAAETAGPVPMNELLEKAKAEGTVTLYHSTPNWEGQAIIQGFLKKYPFMKADQYRQPTYKLWEKLKAEYRGNKKIADVMFCGGAGMVENIRYMTSYVTAEDKNFDHKDPQNRWIAVRPFTVSMMTNRDLVKGADIPKDWTDWINPRPSWKGKIGVSDPRTLSYAYYTVYGLYQTYGLDTLKKIWAGLKKSDPKIVLAATTAAEACVTGEMPIVFDVLMDRWVTLGVEKKAPLEWIYPTSGMIVYNMVAGMLKEAPHPYAGRLLLTYMLSEDCQKILSSKGYYVWRKGITPPSYLKPLTQVKTINVFDEVASEKKRPELVSLWESYFGQ
jgi:iron(III) transport system substrate-binding protein